MRRIELPCTKKTLQLYEEDWLWLMERYGQSGINPVGVTPVIREIIHRKIQELRALEQSKLESFDA